MTAHLTEEEQLEALKRWWKDNGKSTITSVLIIVLGVVGWQFWQDHGQQQAEAASAIYQDLQDTVAKGELTDESKATVAHLAESLKEEYGNSIYAAQAALMMAKLAVDEKRLDDASTELNWALNSTSDEALQHIARLRLARLTLAEGNATEALTLIAGVKEGSFKAAYAELKGDIYVKQEQPEQAREAYQLALTDLSPSAGRRQIVEMKLNRLQTAQQTESEQADGEE